MKLRTLKDLNIMFGKVHAIGGEVGVGELKAEAVKWVKDFEQKKQFAKETGLNVLRFDEKVFANFFNITEWDLK